MAVSTNLKLTLIVKLIGSRKVQIIIRYVSSDAIDNGVSFDKLYQDKLTGIYIWSYDDFIFDERQIRLPCYKHNKQESSYIHEFVDEKSRYETLKKYYKALSNWVKQEKIFPNQNKKVTRDRVTMFEDWWFIG